MKNVISRVVAQDGEQFQTITEAGTYDIADGVENIYIDADVATADVVLNLFDPKGHALRKAKLLVVVKGAKTVTLKAPQGLTKPDATGAMVPRNTLINLAATKTVTNVNGVLEVMAVDAETFIITKAI